MSGLRRYAVRHETVYAYGGEVAHSHQLLHLTPRPVAHQACLAHAIHLDPEPSSRREDIDAFGNPVTRLEYEAFQELGLKEGERILAEAAPVSPVEYQDSGLVLERAGQVEGTVGSR